MNDRENEHLERNSRSMEVAKAILAGYTNRRFLLQFLTEKYNWPVTERTLDNYIKDAKDMLKVVQENELEFEKSLALNRLDALYSINYKINDYRECRSIIETRAKILGFNEPEKVDLKVEGSLITWNESKTYDSKQKAE